MFRYILIYTGLLPCRPGYCYRYHAAILSIMQLSSKGGNNFLDSPYSLTEVRIMFEIQYDKFATVRKIRNILMVDEGYLSRTIDKLRKQGIISKRRSASDGRSFILSLTAQGRNIFNNLERRQEEFVKSMIDQIPAKELEELLAHMQRIKEILTERDDTQSSPA
jgi:DNA-binding MarR family transcriptional regulator